MNKNQRAKVIRRAIRNVWGSLDSHLEYTYKKGLKKPDDNAFHKTCIKEYAQLIADLASLY